MVYLALALAIFLNWKFTINDKFKPGVCLWFGVPRSGKTTWMAFLANYYIKKGRNVYTNEPVMGAYMIDSSQIGKFNLNDSVIMIDEIGIYMYCRDYKSFPREAREYLKRIGHYNCMMHAFSQGVTDADKLIRDLCTTMYMVKPSIIPYCISRIEINKRVIIDELQHIPIDEYYFNKLGSKLIFAPKVWKLFDTHYLPDTLPDNKWEKW